MRFPGNTATDSNQPSAGEKTPDLDIADRLQDGLHLGALVVDLGAYEFVPPFCPWDCQPIPDSKVGINDFLALLGQWDLQGTSCDFGLGTDGVVGLDDFLALLGHWGPCVPEGPAEGPPQSIQDCINRFGTEDPLVLQHCICAVNKCEEGCPPDPTCP